MKNIVTIALIALGTIFAASCSNKRAEIAEQRIAQLTDSLKIQKNVNQKLHNEKDSLSYKLRLTTLAKVGDEHRYCHDTIAIIDTNSYREYLAQCKKIDSLYDAQRKPLQKAEDELDRINDRKKAQRYSALFHQMQLTPEYGTFVQQLVYEHFSAYFLYEDNQRDVLNAKYNDEWESRFNEVDMKISSSVAWTAINKAEQLQYEAAWNLLKSKNLPVKK